jgi:type II secretory pathway pseudopilin PulG
MNLITRSRPRNQRGYILITLMLFVALLTIGMLAMVENIESQIKRDREEELIHRGVQYSRAVRHYFKKFGRYPNRVEDLENTNDVRFLRKRYKDPMTGKDFKLLHMTDVQMSFAGGVPGGAVPGAGLPASSLNSSAASPGGAGPASFSGLQNPSPVQSQTAGQGDTSQPDQAAAADAGGQNGTGQTPGQPMPGTAAPQSAAQQPGSATGSTQLTSQTFGGGPIVGVASISKDKTIRVFNKKDHYNQWQFIYDPTMDRGGLLMTPNQPPLNLGVAVNPAGVTQGTPGQNPSTGPSQQGADSPLQPPQPSPDQK